MKLNPITMLLVGTILYFVIKGFIFKFSSNNLKRDVLGLESNVTFVVSLFSSVYYVRKIFVQHDPGIFQRIYDIIPINLTSYIASHNILIYVVLIPLAILLIYKVLFLLIDLINYSIIYPFFEWIEKALRERSSFINRISGALFQLPKAVCYVLLVTFILNTLAMLKINTDLNRYLASSNTFNYLSKEFVDPAVNSKLAKKLPNIINNSFRVVEKEEPQGLTFNPGDKRVVVYYNGVTLDEGVQSNSSIDSFARNLTANGSTTMQKARILYDWIGSHISYDYEKANSVLADDFSQKSGAIPAFETRKGICFDYACLYVAMARANGIRVRLVTGEGFNGESWVSHAWNQVYIPAENKWINVDPTFYTGGNYFNSKQFNYDHRNAKVVGEW